MEEIKLVRSRKYEDKIKEYNLQDIERHEQEILEKARKYQEYKDRRSKQNVIIRLWYRLLDALRVEYPEEKARKYQEYKDKQSKQNVIIRLWYRLLDALHGNHPERNFTIYPWHTIPETESDKWEIAYFYDYKNKTLNFDNIFHLQSDVEESKLKSGLSKYVYLLFVIVEIIIFALSFIYMGLALGYIILEFHKERMNGDLNLLTGTLGVILIVVMLLLLGGLGYFGFKRVKEGQIKKWKAVQEAKWSDRLAILVESSNNWLRQNSHKLSYIGVLWFGVAIAFHSEIINCWPMKYYMEIVNIYGVISSIIILKSLILSPIGSFAGLIFLVAFLSNVNLWTGITLFITLWTTLLTKEFWMLSYSREVPEYIINPTDGGSRIIEANLLKIKVFTSIGVLMTYYLIHLVDKYPLYYCILSFFGKSLGEELKSPYYHGVSYIIDRLVVIGFIIFIMMIVKDSYGTSKKGRIRNIIDSSISNLYILIYRNVKEVEAPKIKEKVGLSIAYLDKIKPIQLLENSEDLPKDIQVLVEETDDPNKRKVIVIMPDLTVHSGIVEFEP